jgi:hypothetical protein
MRLVIATKQVTSPENMVFDIEDDSGPFNVQPYGEWLQLFKERNTHLTICLTREEFKFVTES